MPSELHAVAGFPSPAEQYVEPQLDLNSLLVQHQAATFFVWVEGDAMRDAGIRDGDLLVVDRSVTPVDGDVIVAAVNGDFVVRRLRMEKSGDRRRSARVWLEAANPNCPELRLQSGGELDLFGVVTATVHRFRKG